MPTYTFYSDTTDGHILSTNGTYSTARSGGTLTADTSGTIAIVGQSNNYSCWEAFLQFDTTFINFASTISSATLSMYGYTSWLTNHFTVEARSYDWGTALTTADWVAGASLSALTSLATFATTGFSTSAYNDFTDVALPANINKSGSTRIICYSSRHSGNNTPTSGEYVQFYMSDQADTTNDPKLTVTWTEVTNTIKKVAGVSNVS